MTGAEPYRVTRATALDLLSSLEGESVDAVITDPPYGLALIGLGWDTFSSAREFQEWTTGWGREALRVLKPGGYCLAFAGTRTYHRVAAGLEDAGFRVKDMVNWLYGSGFPKNRATGLKPAHEPIAVCQKPLAGTVAATVARYGTGALNIDACRVGNERRVTGPPRGSGNPTSLPVFRTEYRSKAVVGRWPANLVLIHADDCEDHACSPSCPVVELDRQSGHPRSRPSVSTSYTLPRERGRRLPSDGRTYNHNDEGGASRFFCTAKPSPRERGEGNTHPTVKPIAAMRWLVRLVTPPGGVVVDPFCGSGTTGLAAVAEGCRFVGGDTNEDYVNLALRRLSGQND